MSVAHGHKLPNSPEMKPCWDIFAEAQYLSSVHPINAYLMNISEKEASHVLFIPLFQSTDSIVYVGVFRPNVPFF